MGDADSEYCDLVMKGGVTSGIVYPNAVLELAKRYRFKNIGGTSAGAIVAAVTAAAARGGRRKQLNPCRLKVDDPRQAGFSGFAGIAAKVREEGFIFSLFQPAKGCGAAFRIAGWFAAKPGMVRALAAIPAAALGIAPIAT